MNLLLLLFVFIIIIKLIQLSNYLKYTTIQFKKIS